MNHKLSLGLKLNKNNIPL